MEFEIFILRPKVHKGYYFLKQTVYKPSNAKQNTVFMQMMMM